jgi:acetyl esterase
MSRAEELMPIAARRAAVESEVYEGMELTDEHRSRVTIEERFIPGPADEDGAPDVRVVVYQPNDRAAGERLPVILDLHGGAFCFLRPETFAGMDAGWAMRHRCVVVSVDYRLAPEHPFPAAPEDCYAALLWTVASADELGIDTSRLVVTGGSAGGALTAAVTLMARDRGGPPIAFQALLIPVLDDRLDTPSLRQAVGNPGFNSAGAEGMWLHYLGEDYDRANTSAYAAPARAESLAGLPPAFIQTNGLDPLRDEGIQYALRLLAEGIPVELYNVPGAYHGAPSENPRGTIRAGKLYDNAIREALHPDA